MFFPSTGRANHNRIGQDQIQKGRPIFLHFNFIQRKRHIDALLSVSCRCVNPPRPNNFFLVIAWEFCFCPSESLTYGTVFRVSVSFWRKTVQPEWLVKHWNLMINVCPLSLYVSYGCWLASITTIFACHSFLDGFSQGP
jgi:hypothetical protein